jgi:hypothetical protein
MKILGIPGSLRKGSFNRKLLQAAASLLPAGAQMDVFELTDIPVYNQDLDNDMPAVRLPEVMVGEAARKFDTQGQLVDETAKNLIGMLLTELVALAESKQTAAV